MFVVQTIVRGSAVPSYDGRNVQPAMTVAQSNNLQYRPDYSDIDGRLSQYPTTSSASSRRYNDQLGPETARASSRGVPSRYQGAEPIDRQPYSAPSAAPVSYRGPPPSDSTNYREYRDSAEFGRDGYRGNGSLPREAVRSKPTAMPVDTRSATGSSRPGSSMQPVVVGGQYPPSGYKNGSASMKNGVDTGDRDRMQSASPLNTSASAVQQYDRVMCDFEYIYMMLTLF